MANFYSDSHGERWGVMIQEKNQSCGPASVAMTKVYYTSSITGGLEAEARKLSQNYPDNFTEAKGTGDIKNLVSVLRAEGVKTYDALFVQNVWAYLYAYARDNTPVLCHVRWKVGGHFIVCVQVYKTDQKCVFLDPWYGLVEISGAKLPTYTVQDSTGTFEPVATGALSGWIIVTKR
ncbi:papain-like cysteine protease family protein [Methylocella silvestris]|uniref:Peptidase C39-like domain-containing protein n=1 Tax=Methylocella silvestris TaxID=199596 RepID=A0A2J7TFM5_METSI|nr:papain-like cysteine protease family protein [Methylocella silvestris]PNG25574.1 hypothetical protein CR492_12650 [Methylocella silvestris]